jgi:cytochrome c-type biogenesis protein CcmE
MRIKPIYLILGVLLILSAVLAYDALFSYMNPYLTVSQVVEDNSKYREKEVQVLGTIVNGSVGWGEDGSLLFNITDGHYDIKVVYTGTRPQNFNEGQKVVIIGKLYQGYIDASEMLIQCPSKYEEGQGEEAQYSIFNNPIFLIAILLGSAALIYYLMFVILKKE